MPEEIFIRKKIGLILLGLVGWGLPCLGAESESVFRKERVVVSSHFLIHYEDAFAPPVVVSVLESLRAKLLLDLGAFSPKVTQEKTHVYLYKDPESYSRNTGMPSWAVAHVNVESRTVYATPSPQFQRVLAHELGHLYFTPFFTAKNVLPPLWLNEGVATLMEWDYGGEGDQERMTELLQERALPLVLFMATSYHDAGLNDGEAVGVWYTQAQSVTRYLMRGFSRAQFVTFCEGLRDGKTLDQSLRGAYGLAVPDGETLETLWRGSLGLQ